MMRVSFLRKFVPHVTNTTDQALQYVEVMVERHLPLCLAMQASFMLVSCGFHSSVWL